MELYLDGILVVDTELADRYTQQLQEYWRNNVYLARINASKIHREEDLYISIGEALQCPGMTDTWYKLQDDICDLEWLEAKQVVLRIDDVVNLFRRDYRKQEKLYFTLLTKLFTVWASYKRIPATGLENPTHFAILLNQPGLP